ncbi:MAG: calcium-binding protein [Dehalococcoidia bacterium]
MNRTQGERGLPQGLGRLAALAAVALSLTFAIARPFEADAAGAVTAALDQGTLVVNGTGSSDVIILRLAAGDPTTLEVDAGGDGIAEFTFPVANIDAIQVVAKAGNDVVAIVESNGPIAIPATIDGGPDDDEITGGSGNDTINANAGDDTVNGGAGDDTIEGKTGKDRLFGGTGNDTLAGGPGNDELYGESGNDLVIWRNGDETDLIEGGDDIDTVEVDGSSSDETFTTTANGSRVRFDRITPTPFFLDIGTSEQLVVNAGGGADEFSATGNLAALIAITVDGGGGSDTIRGSNGVDTLIGGDGADFIDGQQGNDLIFGGAGPDTIQWDPGDGSDVVEGQAGSDTMLFNGSAVSEIFDISPNGSRVRFTRNVGNIVLDLNEVETFELNMFGGADVATVSPLDGTGLKAVTVNAAGFGGAGDAQADIVHVLGTSGPDVFRATRAADSGAPVITGPGTKVTLEGGEPAFDSLEAVGMEGDDLLVVNDNAGLDVPVGLDGGADVDTVQVNGGSADETFSTVANGTSVRFDRLTPAPYALNISNTENLLVKANGGDDHFSAIGNLAPLIAITVDGGAGNDTLSGSNGADVLMGGADNDFIDGQQGADTVLGGAGDDTLQWDPGDGSDVLNGQGGIDTMVFNGSAISEILEFSAIGGHVQFTRNVGNVVLDLNNIEAFDLKVLGGADTITVNSLNGTNLAQVNIDLAAFGGVGDAAADNVIVNGTAGKNVVLVTGDGSVASVSGLKPVVNITGVEIANDRLTVNVLAGNDTVDANGLSATAIPFTAFGGEGNDILTGGSGNDTLFGEDGDDTIVGGPGIDVLDGGAGNNTVSQD